MAKQTIDRDNTNWGQQADDINTMMGDLYEGNVSSYNVSKIVPPSYGYYTSAAARGAVPAAVRKEGLLLTYQTAAETWVLEQFIGAIGDWNNSAKWNLLLDYATLTTINSTIAVLKGRDTMLRYTKPSALTAINYNDAAPTPSVDTKYKFGTTGLCTFISSGNAYVELNDELVVLVDQGVYTYIHLRKNNNILSTANAVEANRYMPLIAEKNSYGVIYSTGSLSDSTTYDTYVCPCTGATEVSVLMPTSTNVNTNFGIAFYSADDTFMYGYKLNYNASVTLELRNFVLKEGVAYFKFPFLNNTYSLGTAYALLYAKKYDAYTFDQRAICYGQSIMVTGSPGEISNSTALGCTTYIPCKGVRKIVITMPVLTTSPTQGVFFYDTAKTPISGKLRVQGAANGKQTVTIEASEIPANTEYFRATYWNFTNSLLYGDFECTVYYEREYLGSKRKLPYQSGLIHFSVKVNQGISNYWDGTASNQEPESFKASTAVFMLPTSYSNSGKKTKLIIYFHGMSRAVTYQLWGKPGDADGDNATFLAQKQAWVDAGYAVLDCNGPCDNAGAAVYGIGSPQAIDAYRKAYEYVMQHYNIAHEVYAVAGSMGGLVGINYCFAHQHVKTLVMLSAWTSSFNCGWGQVVRDPFVTFFGFANNTTYEAAKVQGYDPWLRLINVNSTNILPYFKHPVKLWIGSLESGSVLYNYAIDFVNAIRAAGGIASVRIVDGADHSLVGGGSAVVNAEVITHLNKH